MACPFLIAERSAMDGFHHFVGSSFSGGRGGRSDSLLTFPPRLPPSPSIQALVSFDYSAASAPRRSCGKR